MYSSTVMMDTGPDTYLHVDTHMHTLTDTGFCTPVHAHTQTLRDARRHTHTYRCTHSEICAQACAHPKGQAPTLQALTRTDLFTHASTRVHTSPGRARIPIKPHNRWDCMLGAET